MVSATTGATTAAATAGATGTDAFGTTAEAAATAAATAGHAIIVRACLMIETVVCFRATATTIGACVTSYGMQVAEFLRYDKGTHRKSGTTT